MKDLRNDSFKETASPTLLYRRVLLIEDENRLRDMLLRAVKEMGFEVGGVSSGEAALRVLAQHKFDTLVLDLNLPGINGMELLSKIREQYPAIQVVILTGFGDLDAAKKAIHLDVVDFLTKPASLAELESALTRASARTLHAAQPPRPLSSSRVEDETGAMSLEELERRHILATLERHEGNRGATAAELGISLRKLYYRLGEYQRLGLIE